MERAQKVFKQRYCQKIGIPAAVSSDGQKVAKLPIQGLVCL